MNVQNIIRHNRWLFAVIASAAIAVCAAIAVTTTQADSSIPSEPVAVQPSEPPAAFPPATSPEEAAAGHAAFAQRFGLLREAEQVVLASMVIRDPGIDREAARELPMASADRLARAGATPTEARAWVAPRYDGTLCLLPLLPDAGGPAEVCSTADEASDGYLLMTQSRSDRDVEVYGLVPDGVERVVVQLADGSSSELPVVGNAYAAHFDQPTAAVAFRAADGAEREIVLRSDG